MYKIAAVLLAASMIGGAVQARDTFGHTAGETTVTLLCEGQGEGDRSILVGVTDYMMERYAPAGSFPIATNAFLVRMAQGTVLIDTGYGRKLLDNLASQDLAPQDIETILVTHMHGDHIGGLLLQGKAAFPNAQLYIARPEYDYWITERQSPGALAVTNAYADRIVLFDPTDLQDPHAQELLPGIRAIAAYGHTPAHTMFLVGEGSDATLVWGDVTHALLIQMPFPQVSVTYDTDPAMAARSRLAILRYVARTHIAVAGMHIPWPGMGRVASDGGTGYIFAPLNE